MSKYLKLSSALPGDAETNGLDQFAEALAADPRGATVTAIVIFDAPGGTYNEETAPYRQPKLRIRRAEGWLTEDTPEEVRAALVAAGEKRLNKAPLPFGVLEGDGGE